MVQTLKKIVMKPTQLAAEIIDFLNKKQKKIYFESLTKSLSNDDLLSFLGYMVKYSNLDLDSYISLENDIIEKKKEVEEKALEDYQNQIKILNEKIEKIKKKK